MEAINITAYTSDVSQIEAVKAVLKAFKIQFKIKKENVSDEAPYNPEFVAKIKESQQQYREGKFTRVNINELDSFLGIQ